MVVRYRNEVRGDIDETVDWYESREPGLGRQCNAELSVLLDRIAANPESFPVHARRTRRAVLQPFHQIVFHVIESDHVLVTGVFDGRRHPRSWSDRVRDCLAKHITIRPISARRGRALLSLQAELIH